MTYISYEDKEQTKMGLAFALGDVESINRREDGHGIDIRFKSGQAIACPNYSENGIKALTEAWANCVNARPRSWWKRLIGGQ